MSAMCSSRNARLKNRSINWQEQQSVHAGLLQHNLLLLHKQRSAPATQQIALYCSRMCAGLAAVTPSSLSRLSSASGTWCGLPARRQQSSIRLVALRCRQPAHTRTAARASQQKRRMRKTWSVLVTTTSLQRCVASKQQHPHVDGLLFVGDECFKKCSAQPAADSVVVLPRLPSCSFCPEQKNS
jgi:hypothetical protein